MLALVVLVWGICLMNGKLLDSVWYYRKLSDEVKQRTGKRVVGKIWGIYHIVMSASILLCSVLERVSGGQWPFVVFVDYMANERMKKYIEGC